MNHEMFMAEALRQAQTALEQGEFPVGCVIVSGERILAAGARTGTAGGGNETDHAEMVALRRLEGIAGGLTGALTAYCTMEPCLMCYAALMLHRVATIVYGYEDVMGGGTGCPIEALAPLYREAAPRVVRGVLRERSLELFRAYFADPATNYWRDSPLARYTLSQPPPTGKDIFS